MSRFLRRDKSDPQPVGRIVQGAIRGLTNLHKRLKLTIVVNAESVSYVFSITQGIATPAASTILESTTAGFRKR